jgi:DNA-binding response OmpR family regulator
MSRILVVEDDRDIAGLVRMYLERAGHTVQLLFSGDEVVQHVGSARPDVLILDLMLPGLDGLTICRALRGNPATDEIPIIMLSAKAGESDRVHGLELGADDYVTKPFSPKELVARVDAVERRARRNDTPVIQYRDLTLDRERHVVLCNGSETTLTAKEFLLLEYLLRHRGRVVSRERLLTDVWGYQYTGGTRTVDVHVRRLRKKLPPLIEALATIHQFGYKLLDRAAEGGPAPAANR